jgi:hypothetical protein
VWAPDHDVMVGRHRRINSDGDGATLGRAHTREVVPTFVEVEVVVPRLMPSSRVIGSECIPSLDPCRRLARTARQCQLRYGNMTSVLDPQ